MQNWKKTRNLQHARILIIDDEPIISRTFSKILSTGRFKSVDSLNDPLEAIAKIKEFKPDLVLLDIRMPGMNGIELLKQVRAIDEFKHILMVMLTAAGEESKTECLELGAADYIDKPVNPQELLLRVRHALKTSVK